MQNFDPRPDEKNLQKMDYYYLPYEQRGHTIFKCMPISKSTGWLGVKNIVCNGDVIDNKVSYELLNRKRIYLN